MPKSQSKIPSPARSQGAITPRLHRTRRTLSVASPARSDASVRLSSVVDKFINNDKFTVSPMKRRSVLPDDTEIEAPRRASWWKRLDGSSRDVLEALDTNKMPDDLLVEEYEFEVEKDKQNQTVPESSDNESVASIIVPQRKLFNQKKQPQTKFGEAMGSRKSLGRTNIEDVSIDDAPRNLFNKGPRNKPIFPAALLNSTNKTINKTVEPETNKQTRPNLFGQAGTKRKNMFTDFVLSESEEDSEVQHKVFGFKNKRMSLGTRNRRMPSLTPSMTTEIDIDDWNLLPSSTMIGAPEVSRIITDNDIEFAQEENQDKTLVEEPSLNPEIVANKSKSVQNKSLLQKKQNSVIDNEANDITLTNESIETEDPTEQRHIKENNSKQINKTRNLRKSARVEEKTLQNKSSAKRSNDDAEMIGDIVQEQELGNVVANHQLVENEQSVEEAMAELHGEIIEKATSDHTSPSNTQDRRNVTNSLETNTENNMNNMIEKDKSRIMEPIPGVQKSQNKSKQDINEKHIASSNILQANQNNSKNASQEILNKDRNETSEKGDTKQENQLNKDQQKDVTDETNDDEEMVDISAKEKSEEEIQLREEESTVENNSKEVSQDTEDEDLEDVPEKEKSDEEIEPSIEEHEDEQSSKEVSQENEDVDMDESEEELESSVEKEEDEESSKEVSQENEDDNMDETSEKDESEQEVDQESHNSSKDTDKENQDDMEKMVWDDNDDEKSSDQVETKEHQPEPERNKSRQSSMASRASLIKNTSTKSQNVVRLSVREEQMEQENDVVEGTPNNSTHDTTGRNRKKETSQVKTPEAVLHNITKDNESFRPIGRSTTFRKSKSVIFDNVNIRTSLPPVHESTLGSEGSRNSSTEGSEWDSHRTTRKTIRQTFGKGFTPRKSLRALVMEQSAKRQTEHYNKTLGNVNDKNLSKLNKSKNKTVVDDANEESSKINKTKNKTIIDDANEKDTSKVNKTKNKTIADVNERDTSKLNKTRNKTVIEDVNERNAAAINKTKNKTLLEDVDDHHIRDRRVSTRNISSNHLSDLKSPIHETFTHHVSDPLISEPQVSYHESLQDINVPEMSERQISNRDSSIDISEQANNDSGPEISIHASYGQSMSAEYSERNSEHQVKSHLEISDSNNRSKKEVKQRDASIHKKFIHVASEEEEVLDYEASDKEQSDEEMSEPEEAEKEHSSQENAEQDDSVQESSEQSLQEEEKEDSEPEESEHEVEQGESENEVEPKESEHEVEQGESENEVEPEESEHEVEQEESENEVEPEEFENEDQIEDESQQEEVESEKEESQEEVESEKEESQQEEVVSENEESQEVEAESEQELENEDQYMSQDSVNEISQHESDEESVRDMSEDQVSSDQEENEDDSDHFESGLHSQHQISESGHTDRVVFDNEMSEQEIDYERSDRVSRQMADNDISEQISERSSPNLTRSRVSVQNRSHDVSVGTKKSMLLMQMERIAQQNMEVRQKIREKVQNSLKTTRNFSKMSPIKSKFSIRRMNKPEPKKSKPKATGIPAEKLPKDFVEDLMYKPPKRFQPANAPWITKRLYKFLETKLEPKYDYRARVRAEELVQTLHSFAKLVRRRDSAPPAAVDELKREMARLHVVHTHFDFYEFFHEFMPREIRVKVNPDVVNKIPMPRNGVFAEILQSRAAVA